MTTTEWIVWAGVLGLLAVIAGLDLWWAHRKATIKIAWNDDSAGLPTPTRAYRGDAGWDLYCTDEAYIRPGAYREIPCGFDIELPPDCWALLHSRSSTLRDRKLLVQSSVFDSGYRGPVFVGVWNLGDRPRQVEVGDRLAQLIPIAHTRIRGVRVMDELSESERGANGFGSSGI